MVFLKENISIHEPACNFDYKTRREKAAIVQSNITSKSRITDISHSEYMIKDVRIGYGLGNPANTYRLLSKETVDHVK
ncbi:MAG: hypothetical protein M3162_02530 [Thermoproteota archaeon]|nr:hypothetical protein [Thermoproteota archaeon]